MTEISITVSSLPTIEDESCTDHCIGRIERTWRLYRVWFISIILVSVVCAVIIVVLVLNKNTKTYPCLLYANDTPASSVSVECLQYTWSQYCTSSQYSFSSNYNGWWRRNTQGGYMVRCSPGLTDCGIGSYANILIYMQYCNANYGIIP